MPIINQVVKGGGSTGPEVYFEYDKTGTTVSKVYKPVVLTGIDTIASGTFMGMFEGLNLGVEPINFLSNIKTILAAGCKQMFETSYGGVPILDLSSLTTIEYEGCMQMCRLARITSVDLSSLTTIKASGCDKMFEDCLYLTSANLNSLSTLEGSYCCRDMFKNTTLAQIYLPALVTDTNNQSRDLKCTGMFGNCPIVDIRNLQYVGDYGILDSMFYLNNNISTVNLNSLEYIGTEGARTMFYLAAANSTLQNIYFPMLTSFGTNPFYTNAFTGRLNLTIHFRKDAQATIEALPNYSSKWGAGSGSSILFDLAGTLTGSDGNNYARSEKDSVYASETAGAAKTATAWSYNNTIYYTSGNTEPTVSDTIYSDSACTTPVTTISSIA